MIDLRDQTVSAREVIDALALLPHPEGGYYRETWRDRPDDGARGYSTAILFMLADWEESAWHRVDADELWFWHGGAPLSLSFTGKDQAIETVGLGPDPIGGQFLQGFVPRDRWQSAATLGAWTLVTCVVAPAFRFEGFEIAPPGWRPGR